MKNVAIIVCFLCMSMGVHAQRQDSLATEKIICGLPERMPSFPGGSQALKDFISENLRWPKGREEDCVQGRVICGFKVQADGTCTDFKVFRSLGEDFDTEALRVLQLMPKWIPGEMAGVPSSCWFTLPISFKRE